MSQEQYLPVKSEVDSALGEFVKQLTVPVLYASSDGIDQVGTGTLFCIDDRYFLITAAHLFDDVNPENFLIPSNPLRDINPKTLGKFNIIKTLQPFVDIAVVELLGPETIKRIQSGWRLLTLDNIGFPREDGIFVLCGYVSERAARNGPSSIGGSLVTTYSRRLLEIPEDAKQPIHPDLDLFFDYSDQVQRPSGTIKAAPHLGGTSGAPVWEYRESPKTIIWSPEAVFKIIGVQSAFLKGRYFRAKSWKYVLQILHDSDEHLVDVIDQFRTSLKNRSPDDPERGK